MFTTPLVNSHSANCRVVKRATQITMNHISFSQSCWQPEEEGRTETKEKKKETHVFLLPTSQGFPAFIEYPKQQYWILPFPHKSAHFYLFQKHFQVSQLV